MVQRDDIFSAGVTQVRSQPATEKTPFGKKDVKEGHTISAPKSLIVFLSI